MKYSQAHLLKQQLDASINKLTRTVTGPGVTDKARIRLLDAHVSGVDHMAPDPAE